MSFRNWFKGAKAKAFVVLGSFAMLLGVGASVSAVAATQENEVVETKAANFTRKIWIDKGDLGWFSNPSVSINGGSFQSMTSEGGGVWSYSYTGSSKPTSVKFRHDNQGAANCNTDAITLDNVCNGYRLSSQSDKLYGTQVLRGRCYIIGSASSWSLWSTSAIELTWSSTQWEGSGSVSSGSTFKLISENTSGSPSYKGINDLSNNDDQARKKGQLVDSKDNENIKSEINASINVYYNGTTIYIPYKTTTVTYNNNGGSGTISNQTIILKQNTALTSNNGSMTKTGHTFSGWATSAGGEKTYNDGQTVNLNSDSTLPLYAFWTPNTYTITFLQNDGTGFSLTASKTYGVAFTIPAPGVAPIAGMGSSGGRYFVRWDTKSDGSGISYAAGDSYTTNAALTLHMQQQWYTYQYSINGGPWTNLVRNESYEGDDYVTEFAPASEQSYASGTTFAFRRYHDSEEPESVTINEFQGGNYGSSVVYGFVGKIYVKVTNMNVHDVWVEGYSQRSIEVDHGGVKTMYHMAETSELVYYTDETVTIYAGDIIKGVYNHEDTGQRDVYSVDLLSPSYGDGSFTDSGDVVCNAPGVFVITLSGTELAHIDKVSFAMDTSGSAVLYAQQFNDAIESVCTGIEGGSAASTLSTPWATQRTYYSALTSAAQTAVKSGSSDTDVLACRAKYDQVVIKHGPNGDKTSGITDFMGRNPTPRSGASMIPDAANGSPLTATLWIVLGAGIAGMGAIGAAYFVSKKKKRHEA